jgi:hypothetical protein
VPLPDNLLRDLVGELDERQRDVLERTFGLCGISQDLNAVAVAYDTTRERMRQFKAKTLRILRHRAKDRVIAYILEHGDDTWTALAAGGETIRASNLPMARSIALVHLGSSARRVLAGRLARQIRATGFLWLAPSV